MSENAQRRLREDGRHEFSHKYIVDILNVKRGKTEHGNFLGYQLRSKVKGWVSYPCFFDIYQFLASTMTFNCQSL